MSTVQKILRPESITWAPIRPTDANITNVACQTLLLVSELLAMDSIGWQCWQVLPGLKSRKNRLL